MLFWTFVRNSLPLHMMALHVVQCNPSPSFVIKMIVAPTMKFVAGRHLRCKVAEHNSSGGSSNNNEEENDDEVAHSLLENYGLLSLPPCLGGKYEMNIERWVQYRQQRERALEKYHKQVQVVVILNNNNNNTPPLN